MSIRLAGVALFVIAALYTWYGGAYTASFSDVLGPGVFPIVVGVPMMILSASLVVLPGGQVDWPEPMGLARQGAALAVLLGYAALLKPLGFVLATFALIALLGICLGGPRDKSVVLGAVMSLFLWVLFDKVLGLPLAFLGSVFG